MERNEQKSTWRLKKKKERKKNTKMKKNKQTERKPYQ